MPLFFYHFFYQNHTFFDFFFLIPISLIIFYNVDICDSPVPSGLSLFFFLPPVFLGGVLLAAFDVDFLLVAFFFSAGFSASGLSSDLPPRTLAIVSAELTFALYSKWLLREVEAPDGTSTVVQNKEVCVKHHRQYPMNG